MIVEVKQTRSDLKGQFEIYYDKELAYYGGQSMLTSMEPNVLLSITGDAVLKTQYTPVASFRKAVDTAIFLLLFLSVSALGTLISNVPLKVFAIGVMFLLFVLIDSRKRQTRICDVMHPNGNEVATFSFDRNGFLNSCYTLKSGANTLKAYTISKSSYEYISIYLDDTQIGQINKSLLVWDNLDHYTLYLLDEHQNLADLLSLFIIYFDSCTHGNRGEVFIGVEKAYEWSWDKMNKFYNAAWVPTNFDVDGTDNTPEEKQAAVEADKPLKNKTKLIVWMLGISGIFGLIALVLYFSA